MKAHNASRAFTNVEKGAIARVCLAAVVGNRATIDKVDVKSQQSVKDIPMFMLNKTFNMSVLVLIGNIIIGVPQIAGPRVSAAWLAKVGAATIFDTPAPQGFSDKRRDISTKNKAKYDLQQADRDYITNFFSGAQ